MTNAVPIDFRRPPYLSRRQLQAVRQAHETFAKTLGANLSAFFRIGVEITIDSVELMAYGDFAEKSGTPACYAGLWLPSEAARAVLQLTPGLVFPLLEMILGGNARFSEPVERELTEIERNLLEGVIRTILREWKESWTRLAPIEFLIESVQSAQPIGDLLPPGETVIAAAVDFRISDSRGRMHLAIPALAVRSLWKQSEPSQGSTIPTPTPEIQDNLWNLISACPVTVEAEMEGPSIKFRDLINLSSGQILMFDHPIERLITGTANDSRCYEGRMARKGHKRVFKIEVLDHRPN